MTKQRDARDFERDRGRAMSITIGFDAMRIAFGMQPQEHTPLEVMAWLDAMIKTGLTKPESA